MKWKIQHKGQDTLSATIEPKVCLAFELDTSNERDCDYIRIRARIPSYVVAHGQRDTIVVLVSTYFNIACQRPIMPQFGQNSNRRNFGISHGHKHFKFPLADST